MKNFLRSFFFIVFACGWVSLWAKPKMNVLFIPVDDLNHWVGYTGRNPQAKTPNIDRLSKMGVSFSNAHCSAPARGGSWNNDGTSLRSAKRSLTTPSNRPYSLGFRVGFQKQ